MTDETTFPPICWVHRPHALKDHISEALDLCPECCAKRVAEYRAKYPEHARDICEDGGYYAFRESDDFAVCDECECDLSCYLLDSVYDVSAWENEDRCIDTPAKLHRAKSRLEVTPEPTEREYGL